MHKEFIKESLREGLNDTGIWYHGTPDVRALESEGGFTQKFMEVDYINDLSAYYKLMGQLKEARERGDDAMYHKYLAMIPKLKAKFKLRKPIFLTNILQVAKTYADPKRSFDYQGAKEKVLKCRISSGNGLKIIATGDRFRFIDTNKVKRGFVEAGISESEFDDVIKRFTYYQKNSDNLKTDVIAVIGEWFKFDFIDVIGVLDSYQGGSVKSTVRMVFDPSHITII